MIDTDELSTTLAELCDTWQVPVDGIDLWPRLEAAISSTVGPVDIPAEFASYISSEGNAATPARLSLEQERQLLLAIEQGHSWAREVLVKANLPMITSLVRNSLSRVPQQHNISEETLIQVAVTGLQNAIEKFDAKRGFRFSTYATHFIRQSINNPLSIDKVEAYAREIGVPFIDLLKHQPEADALAAVPAEQAYLNNVLPIKKEGYKLWVAMANPRDTVAIDAIRMVSRCPVQPMAAVPEHLKLSLVKAYGTRQPSPLSAPWGEREPPAPPTPPTAVAAPAPMPEENEMKQLLSETLKELRSLRNEITSLRYEVATLKQEREKTSPTPQPKASSRLFPFAPPESTVRHH